MFKRLVNSGRDLFIKENSSILSAATVIMAASLASALLGLIRTRLLITYFYADNTILDVFWAAFRIPDMVFQIIIVGALSSAFIPVFSKYASDRSSSTLASSMINAVMLVMMGLTLIVAIFARPISGLIAGGFSPAQLDIMANLTRIMAIAQLFFGYSSFLTGIIQSHQRFLIPALSPIMYNIGIILGIVLLGPSLGIYGPAVGVVLGALLHLLAQLPLAHKLGFRYHPSASPKSPAVFEMIRLMGPRMITLSLSQIEATIIVTFSTWLSSGTVTLMTIAQQLSAMPVRLIGVPIGQASLPFFAKQAKAGNPAMLSTMVTQTILQMLYLALPISAIVLVLRIPLVRLAYGADSFPWAETVLTGKLVSILALSIAARSLTHVLVRVFYALHNTVIPLTANLLSTIINVGISYYLLFIGGAGVMGMAFAITVAACIETILLTIILYTYAKFSFRELLFPLGKILLATFLTGFALWGPLRILDNLVFDTTRTIPLILLTISVGLIGIGVYILLSYLLRISELTVFMGVAKKLDGYRKLLIQSKEPVSSPGSDESAV